MYKNMNRRDVLKKGATAAAGAVLAPTEVLSSTVNIPKELNKGSGYNLAKKVWDLSQQAWHERYRAVDQRFYTGVIGILNLTEKGPAHYLMIRSNDVSSESGLSEEYYGPTLNLIAVNGIEPKTAETIDNYLSNLELKYYVPTMDNVTQREMERIQKNADQSGYGITPVVAAVIAIWNKKILGYANKNKLGVLRLGSGLRGNLGTIHSIGWRIGDEPEADDRYHFRNPELADIQRKITEDKYLPILTRAIIPLEKEMARIENLRLNSDPETDARLALEEVAKQKRLSAERSSRKRAAMKKEKDKVNQILQGALEYPV